MFNEPTNVKPTSTDSTYVKSTSMAQTMSSSLDFILILYKSSPVTEALRWHSAPDGEPMMLPEELNMGSGCK